MKHKPKILYIGRVFKIWQDNLGGLWKWDFDLNILYKDVDDRWEPIDEKMIKELMESVEKI